MSFDFPIPLSRDDLTRKSGVNQYVVDEVFPVRLLPAKLQGSVNYMRLNFTTKLNRPCNLLNFKKINEHRIVVEVLFYQTYH